jgi:renin receptor
VKGLLFFAGVPDLNLALEYSSEYPVIFNMILWFVVAFTFTLLAVSCALNT